MQATMMEAMHWIGLAVVVVIGLFGYWTFIEGLCQFYPPFARWQHGKTLRELAESREAEEWEEAERKLESQLALVRRLKKARTQP